MITNTVELISERIANLLLEGTIEYVHTRYTVLQNREVVLETLDFAAALQAYINRALCD